MNSICLSGRLTADVELKQTQSGVPVCSFTIAVQRPNVKNTTDFIDCVAWRHNAEFVSQYFKKGQMIALTGSLTTRKFEDKNGNKRTAYEVVCDRCEFCGGKETSGDQPNFEMIDVNGDLPF